MEVKPAVWISKLVSAGSVSVFLIFFFLISALSLSRSFLGMFS